MPRRTDLKRILVIGSGPIVIGQACEFDYSGTQACMALRADGLEVVLVNSNPATIMTDPELADATYIEPLTPELVEAIIAKERPDALLPTVGGQTALNLAVALHERGVLQKYHVKLIGAQIDAIKVAEDRLLFKNAMREIGVEVPESGAEGVIVAQGGAFGGWTLYAHEGKPAYCYNLFGLQQFKVYGESPIPAGEHQVRVEFSYDGGGLGKGGDAVLFLDGEKVGEGRVEATVPMAFSADETTDIGYESGTTVASDYAAPSSRFTGKITWVQIDLGADDHDHSSTPKNASASPWPDSR